MNKLFLLLLIVTNYAQAMQLNNLMHKKQLISTN